MSKQYVLEEEQEQPRCLVGFIMCTANRKKGNIKIGKVSFLPSNHPFFFPFFLPSYECV